MHNLFVIGIADSLLTTEQEHLLNNCSLIVGSKRFADLAARFSAGFTDITPLAKALTALHEALPNGDAAVLASGDPLFFGIGRRILAEFPESTVRFLPALSSVQRACALFRIPWDDARLVSLHGRKHLHLPGLLLCGAKTLILTDGENSPDRLADSLLRYLNDIGETTLIATIRVLVAEDIGLATERVSHGTLAEIRKQHFSPLNILCLLVPVDTTLPAYCFGLTEELISHSRGLITKNEVRAATLHHLCLPASGVFWDVGAGSGSLSLEAARINPQLTIYVIEQKEAELQNIKKNIAKYRCFNIVPVLGRAPEALVDLPAPDRVFIGGSGGNLAEILAYLVPRLAMGGCVTVNGVLADTVSSAPTLMKRLGLKVRTATMQISRVNTTEEVQTLNPIAIMTGTR